MTLSLPFVSQVSPLYMVNTLACIDNHLVQSKSKSIIGLGSHRSIFSGREHDQKKKKSICPTEDCMRACVNRRDVSRSSHHLHCSPRASVCRCSECTILVTTSATPPIDFDGRLSSSTWLFRYQRIQTIAIATTKNGPYISLPGSS